MKLRTKLVALSLLTLLLPWSGWKLLQELEGFLRESQQNALLASARTIAGSIPEEFSSQLLFLPELYVPLRNLRQQPALDGYSDDWPAPGQGLEFSSTDGALGARLLAGSYAGQLFVFIDVDDATRNHARLSAGPVSGAADSVTLRVRSPRGLFSFTISPEAPGPVQINSERGDSGQVDGYWLERENGYSVELALPIAARNTDISFLVLDASAAGDDGPRSAGPMSDPDGPDWINLSSEWQGLSEWLARSEIHAGRTWLLDSKGWILADSGGETGVSTERATQRTTWWPDPARNCWILSPMIRFTWVTGS
jgi:hypothetical protein